MFISSKILFIIPVFIFLFAVFLIIRELMEERRKEQAFIQNLLADGFTDVISSQEEKEKIHDFLVEIGSGHFISPWEIISLLNPTSRFFG